MLSVPPMTVFKVPERELEELRRKASAWDALLAPDPESYGATLPPQLDCLEEVLATVEDHALFQCGGELYGEFVHASDLPRRLRRALELACTHRWKLIDEDERDPALQQSACETCNKLTRPGEEPPRHG